MKNILKNKSLISEIIEWDISNWARSLDYWLNNSNKINSDLPVHALDIGARNGGISLFLALNGLNVVCSDLENPEKIAHHLHQKYKILDLVTYNSADITNLNYPDEKFDIIVFKSVLGDLKNDVLQKKAISEIYRVLKNDGELWFAENLKASMLHQYLRKKYVRWGTKWRYIESEEISNWLIQSGFIKLSLENYGFFSAFGRSEKQRFLLSYLDQITQYIISDNQKYIIYGVAFK